MTDGAGTEGAGTDGAKPHGARADRAAAPDRFTAREAIALLTQDFRELPSPQGEYAPDGPVSWQGYDESRHRAMARTGEQESVVCGTATVGATRAVLISFEFGFLGGSLGERTGDRLEAAYTYARDHRLPVVSLVATGGSRMQEGMRALVQLQRVARQSTLTRDAGLPQIAVLRDPTTGGGWATLGAGADVILALPGTQVGFAGSRVRPPDAEPYAYTAEAQLEAGAIDAVLGPDELRAEVSLWLGLLTTAGSATGPGEPAPTATDQGGPARAPRPAWPAEPGGTPADSDIRRPDGPTPRATDHDGPAPEADAPAEPRPTEQPRTAQKPRTADTEEPRAAGVLAAAVVEARLAGPEPAPPPHALASTLLPRTGWEAVRQARAPGRPRAEAYLDAYVTRRAAISGDRCGGVDPGMLCGFGEHGGRTIAYAAQCGTATRPAGYRTAARLIRLAGRLGIPVLTLVDTPGAANDAAAERAGAGAAIADLFAAVAAAPVPVTSLVIGEGGSGGALALAAPGNTWSTPDSYFSVIAPELAAAILKRPQGEIRSTADQLRLRPQDLVELGVVRGIVDQATGPGT